MCIFRSFTRTLAALTLSLPSCFLPFSHALITHTHTLKDNTVSLLCPGFEKKETGGTPVSLSDLWRRSSQFFLCENVQQFLLSWAGQVVVCVAVSALLVSFVKRGLFLFLSVSARRKCEKGSGFDWQAECAMHARRCVCVCAHTVNVGGWVWADNTHYPSPLFVSSFPFPWEL